MGVLKKTAMILAAMILAALPALAEAGGFVLPSDLKIVEAEAFAGLGSADEIVVPEGTEVIGARAFAGYAEGNRRQCL